jgi:hypothetical protein
MKMDNVNEHQPSDRIYRITHLTHSVSERLEWWTGPRIPISRPFIDSPGLTIPFSSRRKNASKRDKTLEKSVAPPDVAWKRESDRYMQDLRRSGALLPRARGNAWSVSRTIWRDGSTMGSFIQCTQTNKTTSVFSMGPLFVRYQERPGQRRQSRTPKLPQGFLDPPSQVGPGLLENFTPFELIETDWAKAY